MKVLFLTRYPVEGASSRYRVFQYVPHLEAEGITCEVQSFMDSRLYALSLQPGHTAKKIWCTVKATWRRVSTLSRWREYDALYLQRELLPFGPPVIERWLKRRGAVLMFDYDDALFIKKASRYNPVATLLRSPDKTLEMFRLADCTVAGNTWLRDMARAEGGRAEAVEVAEDTTRIALRTPAPDQPLTIGWLGSPSTVKYLREIEPVLQRIATRHPGIRWEIMGGGQFQMLDVPWTVVPWSLEAELEALSRYDIGLMPLPRQDWSKGKSGGKARTYMAAGVVPVVSAIGYNLALIKEGETGFLCTSPEEWETALECLIGNPALRRTMAHAARREVETRFAPQAKAAELSTLIRHTVQERRTLPPAVVLGLSPTGLHVVRSLGRAGVCVTGVCDAPQPGQASRYLRACLVEPDPDRRLDALCDRFPEGGSKPVLFATSDQDVDWVITHAKRLSRHFRFQNSFSSGLADQIMAKDSFSALCKAHDVACPQHWETDKAGLASLADQAAVPCMIKPARLHSIKPAMGGDKGWIAHSAADFGAIAAKVPDGAGGLLAQEIVPGPESEITVWCGHIDCDGTVRQAFTARKLRQFPPGFGSACLAQSHPEPDSARIAATFLCALGYHGIAAAEFKRAPDGVLQIIEINVRPSLWFSLSEAAGRAVVLSLYRELAGLAPLPDTPQKDGVRWRYGLKDIYSALFYKARSGFVLPAPQTEAAGPAQGQVWAVYEPGDMRPVFAEWGRFVRKGIGRILTKMRARS